MALPRGGLGRTSASSTETKSRDKGKLKTRGGKGEATRAQLHAQAEAEFFKDRIPLMAHQAIEGIEKALWEQVSSMPIDMVREEVEGWIVDPGSMVGRASAHDCLVMLYWVLMNLVTHVAMNIEAKMEEMLAKKEGDLEPSRAWKEHNEEC